MPLTELELLDLVGSIRRENADSFPKIIKFEDLESAAHEEMSRQLTGRKAAIINVYIREWVERTLKTKKDEWDEEKGGKRVRWRNQVLKNTNRLAAFFEIRNLIAHEEKNLPSIRSIREILEEDGEFVALFVRRLLVQAGKLNEVKGNDPPISPECVMRFWEVYMKELNLLAKLLTDAEFASEGKRIFTKVSTLPANIRDTDDSLEFMKAFMKWAKPFVFLNCLPLEKDNPKLKEEFTVRTTGKVYSRESRINDFWLHKPIFFPDPDRVEWSYANLLEKAPSIRSNCAPWRGFRPSVGIGTLRPLTIRGDLEAVNKIVGNLNRSGDERLTVDLEGVAHSIALRQQAWLLKHPKSGESRKIASDIRDILIMPRTPPFKIETGKYLEEVHTGLKNETVQYSYTDNPKFALVIQERNVEMPADDKQIDKQKVRRYK